jgi:hypothetical protein
MHIGFRGGNCFFFLSLSLHTWIPRQPFKKFKSTPVIYFPSHLVNVFFIIFFLISHEITYDFQFHPLLILNLLDLVFIILIIILLFLISYKITIVF